MANESLKSRHLFVSEHQPLAPEGPEARARADLAVAVIGPPEDAKAEAKQSVPPPAGKDAPARLSRLVRIDAAAPRVGDDICLDEDGNRAGGDVPVACPSAPLGRFHLGQQMQNAAKTADGIVLSGLDAWYRLGRHGAGFCPTCEMALTEAIRKTYGEHVQPFRVLEALRAPGLPAQQRPFFGLKESLRLSEPLTAARLSILRARDEARKSRNLELPVFGSVKELSALALALAPHLDGLLFSLPDGEPLHAVLPLLAARAAMGERPAIAVLPGELAPARVGLYAALAAACDVDVMLEAGASEAARKALQADRQFQALLRERYRPMAPLADVFVFLSPRADHLAEGVHLKATQTSVAALASANLQLSVKLGKVPVRSTQGDAALLLVAGLASVPSDQEAALRHFVTSGGDLVLVGPSTVVDDEGRALRPLFPEAKAGLERVGEGRIWTIVASAQGELPQGPALEQLVLRAARELMGRRKPQLSISGRGALWARAYLDPERKLDVHLTNLELKDAGSEAPTAQGMLLTIAGAAAGGGRSGYWFAPGSTVDKDGDRLSLNPSGFSVSCVLPGVGRSGLLSVPR